MWREFLNKSCSRSTKLSTLTCINLYLTDYQSHLVRTAWLVTWFLRSEKDPTRLQDVIIYAICHTAWTSRSSVSRLFAWFLTRLDIVVCIIVGTVVVIALALSRIPRSFQCRQWNALSCLKPLILPCRTTHTRLIPKHHAFGYRYLQVSVPIDFVGNCGRLLSVGKSSKWTLLSVSPEDYLQRHYHATTLREKLVLYLESQGVSRDAWHHAYLVTAPRFLGYSFNPVSFWYIYDSYDSLSMVIAEVNNTFDERRIYLEVANDTNDTHDSNAITKYTRFQSRWEKDFHVSPFNSRKGHYSLSLRDPFHDGLILPPGIDININLSSSKKQGKLVTRLWSESEPLSPENVTVLQLFSFILQWSWMGLFTFPRILKEAFLLFFRRKLHVWLRPEVRKSSIGRKSTNVERALERFISTYLCSVTRNCQSPAWVNYRSGIAQDLTFVSKLATNDPEHTLDIHILSPTFFTRVVSYSTVAEALESESSIGDFQNTVYVSQPGLLARLFRTERELFYGSINVSVLDRARWYLIPKLRKTAKSKPDSVPDFETFSPRDKVSWSCLDVFVATTSRDAWLYRRIVTLIILSQKVAFGHTEIVSLLDFIFRGSLICSSLAYRPKSTTAIVLQYMVHIWAFVKGQS